MKVHAAAGSTAMAEASDAMGRQGSDWSGDRVVAVGYGVFYDYIFERFAPYQALRAEIRTMIEASAASVDDRRAYHVLDVGCGPGNFTLMLGEAGFTVVGLDPYEALIDLAREKRRARRLPNVSFKHADLVVADPRWRGAFDHVLNVHSLYAHPAPQQLLRGAWEVLKPGGHGLFVNFARRAPLVPTFLAARRREGWRGALHSLRWVLPNAVFEATRRRLGPPNYWQRDEFEAHLSAAGFTVLDMRRTFFDGVSLLARVQKTS
jgi:SAM-dependent methyltransferase